MKEWAMLIIRVGTFIGGVSLLAFGLNKLLYPAGWIGLGVYFIFVAVMWERN